jgi:hypothetical protein
MLASVRPPTSRSDGYSLDNVMVGLKKRLIPFRDQISDGTSRGRSHDSTGKYSCRKRRLYVLKTSCCFNRSMKDEMKFQELRIRRCLGSRSSRTEFRIPNNEMAAARKYSLSFQQAYGETAALCC